MDVVGTCWRAISERNSVVSGFLSLGKTTILQAICNTKENLEIYDSEGEKGMDSSRLMYVKPHN